jgi:hypothetical protein
MRSRVALAGIGLMLLASCSGGEGRVTGVLTDVDGDLTAVESFEIVSGGERLRFVPDDGLDVFGDDGTPLSHLFEHLQAGEPIRVTYRVEGDTRVAIMVEDG